VSPRWDDRSQTERDVAAAVVTDDGEPLVAERTHPSARINATQSRAIVRFEYGS
jgi:hypothetical protein